MIRTLYARFALLASCLILCLFFVFSYYFIMKHSQSIDFVDESEHLTQAFSMVTQGNHLYKELSTNHQPLPILLAVPFWKLVPIANLFMLIERTRQLMWALSFAGALLLVLRFRLSGLLAVVLIETSKYYFLGYHLLAESLVIYPIMYLVGVLGELALRTKKQSSPSLIIDDIGWAIATFLVAFNLLPTWPFLCVATVLYFFLRGFSGVKLTAITLLICTAVLFLIVSPLDWFRETILNNSRYFVPYKAASTIFDYARLVFYPFLHFLTLNEVVSKIYASTVVATVLYGVLIGKTKITLERLFKVFILGYALIILLNLRITDTAVSFYTAFHLLPQLAALIMAAAVLVGETLPKIVNNKLKALAVITSVCLLGIVLFNSTMWWQDSGKVDKQNEHFIHYSSEDSLALVINTMKVPTDTLLAGPQSFLNVAAQVPLANKQTAFLPWAYRSYELRRDFQTKLVTAPPTFIYFTDTNSPYFSDLAPLIAKGYTPLTRSFGGDTHFYMRTDRANQLSNEQRSRLNDLLYTLAK